MNQLLKLIVFIVSITAIKADLIGFNRLGNNVHNFYRFRDGRKLDYQLQNYQSILENNVLSMGEKQELLKLLTQSNPTFNHAGKQRRQHARRNQFLNRRKTQTTPQKPQTKITTKAIQTTSRRVSGGTSRLLAYKRRMKF